MHTHIEYNTNSYEIEILVPLDKRGQTLTPCHEMQKMCLSRERTLWQNNDGKHPHSFIKGNIESTSTKITAESSIEKEKCLISRFRSWNKKHKHNTHL
mmetsp:Transcript_6514/g.9552  ORF Transcript_6514/g.9552 Transcript_6514/m.9552 type:complete len:98 (-) Transcript_6514:64-357(-)